MHKKSRRVNKRQRRQKCRSRKGGRRMRMKMKGGLNPLNLKQIDYPHAGLGFQMQVSYSFRPDMPVHITQFKQYVFGSDVQRVAWESLLTNCHLKGVPVFILSAGNKIGIIRMLQLMGLDAMFEDVLCTNPNTSVNPPTKDGTHNFKGQTKYNVIRTILRERSLGSEPDPLVAVGPPIGYLMDDDASNDDLTVPNKSIPFVNVNSAEQPQTADQINNIFYNFVNSYPVLQLQPLISTRAFADVNVINPVASLVEQGKIKILFIDFDKTFSQYAGALPFHDDAFISKFYERFKFDSRYIW